MHTCSPAISQLVFYPATRKAQPGLVDEGEQLVGIRDPNHYGRGVRHVPEAFFAFAKHGRSASSLARRDRSPDDHDHDQNRRDHAPGYPSGAFGSLHQIIRSP